MTTLKIYQYLGPLLLFPTCYYLWWKSTEENHFLVGFIMVIPVLWAYIIPGLGTNWLGLWEFHTRLRLGRFRPHHGFVFGTATGLFALATLGGDAPHLSLGTLLQAGFLLGTVLAFWNWLYDSRAIQVGLITVYNRPYAAGQAAEVIAADYAPALFGTFGFCYGVAVRLGQAFAPQWRSWGDLALLLLACTFVALLVPVLVYMLTAYVRYGDFGLRAYSRSQEEVI